MKYCSGVGKKRNSLELWEADVDRFLKNETWNYNFEELGKEEELTSYSKSDYEQSHLSRMIFARLFKFCDIYKSYNVYKNIGIVVNDYENQKNEYYFDLMNNPKEIYPLGKMAKNKCEDEWNEWKGIYHTIGNFSPVPILKNNGRILQNVIHRGECRERWDKLLIHLKDKWEEYYKYGRFPSISFKDYMKATCQHLYFNDIFIEFYREYKDKDISNICWEKQICDWNKKIDNNDFNCKILFFDEESVEDTIREINFLIKVRGICIMELLKSKLTTSGLCNY